MPAKPKFTKRRWPEFLTHLRNGMRPGAAAEVLGFPRQMVFDAIGENEDLAAAVADAEREATEHVEEALYQAAISGNVTACRMWLDLRKPKSDSKALVPLGDEETVDEELAQINALAAGKKVAA